MRWREAMRPVRMQRVALAAPVNALRDLLVTVADEGTVAFDEPGDSLEPNGAGTSATARLQRLNVPEATAPALARRPDLDAWEKQGRVDLLAGEAQLEQRAALAVTRRSVAAVAGWMPSAGVDRLAQRLRSAGAAVVPLPPPRFSDPPTLLPETAATRQFAPLVETYATVPYQDVNPSVIAGLAYVVMFGMMFADVGHGALLLLAAVAIRLQWWHRLDRLRPAWLFLAGAGVASAAFGALYGEFFGPTGVMPVIWLAPLDHPVLLLGAAVAVGAVLLAGAYVLGTVNRVREGGWALAAFAPTGLAGAALFLGLGAVAAGLYAHRSELVVIGVVIAAAGMAAAFAGLLVAAGGRGSGAVQAGVELFDLVVRLGSNLVSFARLAAFGLTHAALGQVVWQATTGSWRHGAFGAVGAVLIFAVGNAVTFGLEGLVAGIQALRLEYYELFSRIFAGEGRPFRPWHVPLASTEAPCSPG